MSLLNSASLVVTPNGYKAGTLYSVIPNSTLGDMTVVRATTATRVNSAGLIESVANNVPRLDYLNGICPSLLVEPQRTNLLTYSEQFDNAAWTKLNGTVSANQAEAPDGTISADLFYPTTSGTDRLLAQTKTSTIGQTFTSSAFVKSSGVDWVLFYAANLGGCWFNASIGVFGTVGSGVTASVLGQVNGFWRISLTATIANTNVYFYIGTANANGTSTITKNGTDGILVWGAQVELGSYATSYIPTTSAAVTRNADEIYKTGISSLINSTEGVLFIETKGLFDAPPISTYIQLSKNGESGFDNSLVLQHRNNGYLRVYVNGSATTNLNFNIDIDFTQNHKIAVLYKLNGYKLFIDGVAQSLFGTPTQTVFSGLDNLSFDLRGSNSWNAKIKNLIVFPSALSDTELTELTTL
jgi:hypothetical protein